MQKIGFLTNNNSTFILSLDFSQVADLYPDVTGWTVRMQMKNYPTDNYSLFEWTTGGTVQGSVVMDPVTFITLFSASQSKIAAFSGLKYFDIRIESPTGEFVIAYGEMIFMDGITESPYSSNSGDGAGLGDTVLCTYSQNLSSPVLSPLSVSSLQTILDEMSACVTSAAAAATAAEASLASIAAAQTAAVLAVTTSAAFTTFSETDFINWLNSLPTSLPSVSNQWWLDKGSGGVILARS